MKRSDQGSAHIVIITILVLALLGALGFVFWQNFINKPKTEPTTNSTTSSTNKTTPVTTPVKLLDSGVASSFPTPLTWKVPETWSIDSTGNGPQTPEDSAVQNFTLTSPSGKYSVVYSVGVNGGRGGTCGDDTSTFESISQQSISGLPAGRFVEYIIGDTSSGYVYGSGIFTDTSDLRDAKKGTSSCVLGLGGVTLSTEHTYTLLEAEIQIKDLVDENGSPKSTNDIATIKGAYATDEYTQAVNILLSTKLGD